MILEILWCLVHKNYIPLSAESVLISVDILSTFVLPQIHV
jgi:hypothetical protein